MWKRERVDAWYFTDFHLQGDKKGKRIYMLLHGYEQNCDYITSRLESSLPKNALILAPNGPFPLPKKTSDGLVFNFAWYFYDNVRSTYYIDYQLPATILKGLVENLHLQNIPMTVIGFSQGGYLAPFVGQIISSVDHVVGIACRFCHEQLGKINFKIDAIHGRSDSIVDPGRAKLSHEELIRRGALGEFHLLDEGHKLGKRFKDGVKKLVHTHDLS